MIKIILLTLMLAFNNIAFAQKTFIGQTKNQVKEFWELNVSNIYFFESTSDDSTKSYFDIMTTDVGSPEFSATFDNKGKCISHYSQIKWKDISVMQARLKKAGYTFNDTEKLWINQKKTICWWFEPYGITNMYFMKCKKYK